MRQRLIGPERLLDNVIKNTDPSHFRDAIALRPPFPLQRRMKAGCGVRDKTCWTSSRPDSLGDMAALAAT